jgi:photosystem II stability/assembly factor-like uncharacterized protein
MSSSSKTGPSSARPIRLLPALLLLLPALLHPAPSLAKSVFWTWSLSEFQPDIPNGGRANSIAIDPTNDNHQWVASETGGVFESSDRGVNWRHIDLITAYNLGEITYLPNHPSTMLLTAGDDFSASNEKGGLWRSDDAGVNWTHLPPLAVTGVGTRFAASDISVAPDTGKIYVATTLGVAVSADNGQSWSLLDPFGPISVTRHVTSVVALSAGTLMVASGDYPHPLRSTDDGQTWAALSGALGKTYGQHAFGTSPIDPQTVYYVDSAKSLYYSEDAGATWTQLTAVPPGGPYCGGIGFLQAAIYLHQQGTTATRSVQLFFSNRCELWTLDAPEIAQTGHLDYSGTWTKPVLDHGDTRALAFTHDPTPVPLLLGTDGGLHVTADGGAHWSFTGAGAHGYHALQILEARAQRITSIPRTDLYFTTQDNSVWASGDNGRTWKNAPAGEGYFLNLQPTINAEADSLVAFLACGNCFNATGPALLSALNAWPDAPSFTGQPAVINRNRVLQNVRTTSTTAGGLDVSLNQGATWSPYASFPESHLDIPRAALVPRPGPFPYFQAAQVYFQAIAAGFNATQQVDVDLLVKVTQPARRAPSLSYPAMNGFGSIGMRPAAAGFYQVFAVDPLQGNHLIAPDLITGKVMESTDGGDHWADIAALSTMVSESGRYLAHDYDDPFVQAVSFYADDPNLVAVGTFDSGVFISSDRGKTWEKVPGSEHATFISSIDWISASDLLVSTYGRGLWRIHGQVSVPSVPKLCVIVNCVIKYIERGDPPPDGFDTSIVAVDGGIRAVTLDGGKVQGIAVSAGTALAYGGEDAAGEKIAAVETAKVAALGNLSGAKQAKARGWQLIGLGMNRGHELRAAVYAAAAVSASPEPAMAHRINGVRAKARAVGAHLPPSQTRPYLSIDGGNLLFTTAEVRERIPYTLLRPPAKQTMEIWVDGSKAEELKAIAGESRDGAFAFPRGPGQHRILVKSRDTGEIIAGSPLFVVR